MTSTELTGKHARWALMLQDFDFTIEHRPGLKHQNADVPSRFPRARSHPSAAACLASMSTGRWSHSVNVFFTALRINLMDGLEAAGAGEGFIDDCINLMDGWEAAGAGEGFIDDFAPTADQLFDGYAYRLSKHNDALTLTSG